MAAPINRLLLQADLERTIYEDTPPLQRMTAEAVIASLGELKPGGIMGVELERCFELAESLSTDEARGVLSNLAYQLAFDPEHLEERNAACVALLGIVALQQNNEDPGSCKGFQALEVTFGAGSSEYQPDPALLNPHRALATVAKLEELSPALAELCRVVADGAISPTDATLVGKMRDVLNGTPEKAEEPFVPTPFQAGILDALEGRALKTEALAAEVGDRRRLFKPGGIKELKEKGLVKNHSRIGYYRPDAPPPEIEEFSHL